MSRHCLADCIVQSSKPSVHKLAAQSEPQSKAYNGYLVPCTMYMGTFAYTVAHVAQCVPLSNPLCLALFPHTSVSRARVRVIKI